MAKCKRCNDKGTIKCPKCEGKGEIILSDWHGLGTGRKRCDRCDGTGGNEMPSLLKRRNITDSTYKK